VLPTVNGGRVGADNVGDFSEGEAEFLTQCTGFAAGGELPDCSDPPKVFGVHGRIKTHPIPFRNSLKESFATDMRHVVQPGG
jgi:hypothetical protein